MGTKGPKASNIFQNPGIKNNPGDIKNPYIKGTGTEKASPAKTGVFSGSLTEAKK